MLFERGNNNATSMKSLYGTEGPIRGPVHSESHRTDERGPSREWNHPADLDYCLNLTHAELNFLEGYIDFHPPTDLDYCLNAKHAEKAAWKHT